MYLIFFFKQNFSKWSYAHVKSSFWQPCQKVFVKSWKFFAHFWKQNKNTKNFFKKLNFLQKFLVDTQISVSTTLFEIFWQKAEKVCSKNETDKKKYIFLKKEPSLKCSSGHIEYSFYNRKIYAQCPKVTEKLFFSKSSPQNISIET